MSEHRTWWLVLWFLLAPAAADALPLYTARGGRTCDNCHTLPNTWHDPPQFWRRKCTMSCVGCHVDPNGGGLRTVSGRYYGLNTLPMFAADHRPIEDRSRELTALVERLRDPQRTFDTPSSQPTSGPVNPVADRPEDPRGSDAPPADDGWLAFGRPLFHGSSEMAWLDGRYDDQNADPLLLLGADARFGYWSAGPLFFPMQADVYAAVHPVEHLTLATTFGARGRTRSLILEGAGEDEQPAFGVRDLWVMTHEWPLLAHLRAGRFLPAFGTRVADHTAYIRRAFGLSQEDPANRVIGVEVGMAPNYPYFTASAFKTSTLDARNPLDPGDGQGLAVSAGWRDLGWQLGASAMVRRRPAREGGDTEDFSLQWGLNPWFYWKWLPLTYLGEAAWGTFDRPFSGAGTSQIAQYHELDWTVLDGLVARLRYDFWDPDVALKEDQIHRPGLGFDLTVVPGLTLGVDGRVLLPAGGSAGADAFIQIHGWL